MSVKKWILFSLYLSFGVVTAFEGCKIVHGRRGCIDKILRGVLVTCDGGGTHKEIPKDIPDDTVYLSLANFNFGRFTKTNFTHLQKVECMVMIDSGISAIESDSFTDMKKLQELELQKTRLSSRDLQFINHPQFTAEYVTVSDSRNIKGMEFNGTKYLNKIKLLRLGGNRINAINPSILQYLVNVETLDLSNNRLESIDWSYLSLLTKLNNLYLDGNNFQMFPKSAIDTLSVVKESRLGNNQFHCSCKMKWLKEYYETAVDRILDYDIVECVSPVKKRMMDTSLIQFSCSPPEKPSIIWSKLSDTEYRVHCSSFGDPTPTLTLTLPGMNPFVYLPSHDLSKLNVTTPVLLASPGTVICEAKNTEDTIETTVYIRSNSSDNVREVNSDGITKSNVVILSIILWTALLVIC